MKSELIFSYLAGAMDSDGFFSIKKSTYHIRVRHDAVNPLYSERAGLKQVTPDVPHLLKEKFGGTFSYYQPPTPKSKALYGWDGRDKVALLLVQKLLPYLRIKRAQADSILELRSWKDNVQAHQYVWWWLQENPDWRTYPMLTTSEVATIMGYTSRQSVFQAHHADTLISLPRIINSHVEQKRFPAPLIGELVKLQGRKKRLITPPQLISKYEELYQRVRQLNAIGDGTHPINMRTGFYTPK